MAEGRDAGCRYAIYKLDPGRNPDVNETDRCMDAGAHYTRDLTKLADQVTKFFKDHPEDRIMFPEEVLVFLSDELHYTNDQIHEKCKSKLNCRPNSV